MSDVITDEINEETRDEGTRFSFSYQIAYKDSYFEYNPVMSGFDGSAPYDSAWASSSSKIKSGSSASSVGACKSPDAESTRPCGRSSVMADEFIGGLTDVFHDEEGVNLDEMREISEQPGYKLSDNYNLYKQRGKGIGPDGHEHMVTEFFSNELVGNKIACRNGFHITYARFQVRQGMFTLPIVIELPKFLSWSVGDRGMGPCYSNYETEFHNGLYIAVMDEDLIIGGDGNGFEGFKVGTAESGITKLNRLLHQFETTQDYDYDAKPVVIRFGVQALYYFLYHWSSYLNVPYEQAVEDISFRIPIK